MSTTNQSDLVERNVASICRNVLNDATNDVLAVGLSTEVIDGLLTVLTEREDSPSIRLLAAESVLKGIVSDFTDASTIADFVARDVLSLRVADDRLDGPLLITDERVVVILPTENLAAGFNTDDDEFVEAARGWYTDHWNNAESFTLRTPPLSRVQETLDDEFGAEFRMDFDRMHTTFDTDRSGTEFDEVDISLLTAAKNEVLLYDISVWGESVGVASRATFSRKKVRLEEMGLIDTEKVPIDVGRPRLRLLLSDERLQEVDPEEVVNVAESILSAAGS